MADMTLGTANKIDVDMPVETSGQLTLVAAEAITAGAPVLFNSSGKWINADANGTGTVGIWGIATKTVAAGEALTAIRHGFMSGWSNLPAYGNIVYVSNTAGALADAAGGTSLAVGHVVPRPANLLGVSYDKTLYVNITGTGLSA